jgi:hypothetical protein
VDAWLDPVEESSAVGEAGCVVSDDGIHIPTAKELVGMGLATEQVEVRKLRNGQKRTTTFIRISDEGHALLGERMREKAKRELAAGMWHGVTGTHPAPPPQPGVP